MLRQVCSARCLSLMAMRLFLVFAISLLSLKILLSMMVGSKLDKMLEELPQSLLEMRESNQVQSNLCNIMS